MGNRKILLDEFGPLNPQRRIIHVDDDSKDGTFTVETLTDVEPAIDYAKMMSERPKGREMRFEAAIPMDVLERSFTEGWFHDPKAWKRWANDPQNKPFRADYGNGVKTL